MVERVLFSKAVGNLEVVDGFFCGQVVGVIVCDICWGIIGKKVIEKLCQLPLDSCGEEKGNREPSSKPEAKPKRNKS
ncbi:TPA: hypothetical protein VBX77_004573 [Yersinia enterocolitica]|nr:hypothetical protein [Yersinia enterocolitica]